MDEATYLALCQREMQPLYRIACSIVGSPQDAEDAVQQALLNAWRAREKARSGSERAWMMQILVNECRSILRKRRRLIPVEEVPCRSSGLPEMALNDALRALPESLRTPLLLKYMEGMTEKEVAAALRLSIPGVKNRLYRARKALQKQLDEEVSP